MALKKRVRGKQEVIRRLPPTKTHVPGAAEPQEDKGVRNWREGWNKGWSKYGKK